MTEFETVKIRNAFTPRWWQLRRRYRLWQFYRDVEKQEQRMIALIGRDLHDEVKRELESRILIGPGDGT